MTDALLNFSINRDHLSLIKHSVYHDRIKSATMKTLFAILTFACVMIYINAASTNATKKVRDSSSSESSEEGITKTTIRTTTITTKAPESRKSKKVLN